MPRPLPFADFMTGPGFLERSMSATEGFLTRIAGLLDGLVWWDGVFRGAVVATLALVVLYLYRNHKPGTPWLVAMGLLLSPALANGQEKRENVVPVPSFQSVTANAPIPPKFHVRNEGGSDGAGLCVISSVLANGQYQGVPGLMDAKGSKLWQTAKQRPGGYGPDKLINLLRETLPGEPYTSYTGTNRQYLHDWSAAGYPIGATMNTGELYNWRPIHHMISLIHYSLKDGWACVVDNNDPGNYHWMRATEYDRRWPDGGVGWAFRLDRLPKRYSIGLVVLLTGVALLIWYELESPPEKVAAHA